MAMIVYCPKSNEFETLYCAGYIVVRGEKDFDPTQCSGCNEYITEENLDNHLLGETLIQKLQVLRKALIEIKERAIGQSSSEEWQILLNVAEEADKALKSY